MAIGRKGIIFTFAAIALLVVTITLMHNHTNYRLKDGPFVAETRIVSMDRFVADTETDLERALYIASFRALLAMNDRIESDGKFIQDFNQSFASLVLNGTYNGTNLSLSNDSNLQLWVGRMSQEASTISLSFALTNPSISVRMISPWKVESVLNSTISIQDFSGTVGWTRKTTTVSVIPIEGFLDPVYTVGSRGIYFNNIHQTAFRQFVNGGNTANLYSHWKNHTYVSSTASPDFLQRLAGDLNATSANGIESLVDIEALPGVLRENKTAVDFIYWGNSSPMHCPIDTMPSTFRLDNATMNISPGQSMGRLEFYGVQSLTRKQDCSIP